MTRNGEPIQSLKIKHTVESGIAVEPIIPGVVPLYYEIQACRQAGLSYFGSWQELGIIDKATLIAHYYLANMIESHQNDAQIEAMPKSKGARGGRKR